jgi:replicative DNA helicase
LITNLQKSIFEKFITDSFLEKFNTAAILSKNTQSIIPVFKQFIDEIINIYKQIRYDQLSILNVIDKSKIEQILNNETKYHILLFTKEVLNAKENNSSLFNNLSEKENIFELIYSNHDKIQSFIENLKQKINTIVNEGRSELTDIYLKEAFDVIELFNEIKNINNIAADYEILLKNINENKITSIYSLLNQFKEVIQNSYIKIVESSVSKEKEKNDILEKHSIITFGSSSLSETITDYITDQYDILPTGLRFIDDVMGGLESENTYMFCAPSNHGKSLMLIDIGKSVIKTNINEFDKNDVILHITLEDNKVKLSRRIFTIFGNYPPRIIKKLYYTINKKYRYLLKTQPNNSELINYFKSYINTIFHNLEVDSIKSITKDKVLYMIQDQSDGNYSSSNLLNTLTILKLKGYRVRLILLDYIDLMTSSKKLDKEYDEHGQIVKDLRSIAKEYHVPIVSVTQLKRETENPKVPLTNTTMGDSYKKVRFSDYIFMLRQLYDFSIDEILNYYPINKYTTPEEYNNLIEQILPAEYAITKVKDSDKTLSNNDKKYLLFSKFNLRFYDNVEELYNDYKISIEKQHLIESYINNIYNFESTYKQLLFSNQINSNLANNNAII